MKYDIPKEFKPFVNSVKRQCRDYKVDLVLSPSRKVVVTDDFETECGGYFDGDNRDLVVACGKPFEKWVEILVHESSHMDQWKSDDRWDKWGVSCSSMWAWLSGEKIMNRTQVSKMLDDMIELEKDCEMRAVEKIKKWGLPINVGKYIQRANIYLYSYGMMHKLKKFPTDIYSDNKLVAMASSTFKKNYKKVPEDIAEHMVRFYSQK
jgi:hypothetical protein